MKNFEGSVIVLTKVKNVSHGGTRKGVPMKDQCRFLTSNTGKYEGVLSVFDSDFNSPKNGL